MDATVPLQIIMKDMCRVLNTPSPHKQSFNNCIIHNTSTHAEQNLLLTCKKKNLSPPRWCTVFRMYNGILKDSRPCSSCILALKRAGVEFIYYSTGNPSSPIAREYLSTIELRSFLRGTTIQHREPILSRNEKNKKKRLKLHNKHNHKMCKKIKNTITIEFRCNCMLQAIQDYKNK